MLINRYAIRSLCLFLSVFVAQAQDVELFPAADADVYAYSYRNWNNANMGTAPSLVAGWHPNGGEKRAFFRFDIPANAQFSKAILQLSHTFSGDRWYTLGVHQITSPWNEGTGTYHSGRDEQNARAGDLSWNQQPTINPVPVTTFDPGVDAGWIQVDITRLVKMWQSGTPNYGFVIKAQGSLTSSSGNGWHHFASRETYGDGTSPKLVLKRDGSSTGSFGTGTFVSASLHGNIYALPTGTNRLPDFSSMTPIGTIYTTEINVPTRAFTEGFPGVTDRFEWFGIRYTGVFSVAQGGEYGFRLTSDDGSKLWINGDLLIDNDGVHPSATKRGTTYLSAGTHRVQLDYFQGPRTQLGLQLFMTPPGGTEAPFKPTFIDHPGNNSFGNTNGPNTGTGNGSQTIVPPGIPIGQKLAGHPLNLPKAWEVNCNGYMGYMVLDYNAATDKVTGTVLGTPAEGYLVGRHLVLHRFPQGRTQIWDGWILDPALGAAGQAYYDTGVIISGTCSEDKGNIDGVYPWFGVEAGKRAGLPSSLAGGGSNQAGGTLVNNGNNFGGNDSSWLPGFWIPKTDGVSTTSVNGDELCVSSQGQGGAWFRQNRWYSLDSDYQVQLEFKPTSTDNHYVTVFSDGFVFAGVEWGLDVGHAQPGARYNQNWLRDQRFVLDKWHRVVVNASPRNGTFELVIDGKSLSTATGITPVLEHHISSPTQNDPGDVWFGEAFGRDTAQSGSYNRGSGCWRNIRVSLQSR